MKHPINSNDLVNDKALNAEELEEAETKLSKYIRHSEFKREVEFIKSKQSMGVNTPILVNQFDLFVYDRGILKDKSKLEQCRCSRMLKSPEFKAIRAHI